MRPWSRGTARGTSCGTSRNLSRDRSCGFAFGDGAILLQPRLIVCTFSDEQIAEQALGFHDAHVGFFREGDQIVGRVAFDQAIVTPVEWHADLVNELAADLQRLNSRRGKRVCFNSATRRDQRYPLAVLDIKFLRT